MPRELEVLRGSDLVAWYLKNSACRPLKGVEPSTGNALLQIRLRPPKGARTPSCGACQRGTAVCSPRYWHYPENTPKQKQKSGEAASTNLDTPDLASGAKQIKHMRNPKPPVLAIFWLLFVCTKSNRRARGRAAPASFRIEEFTPRRRRRRRKDSPCRINSFSLCSPTSAQA